MSPATAHGPANGRTGAERPMVEAHHVRKSFGRLEVLKGIDLEVSRGTVTCLIGPSGSGKSTLLRCVNHLEQVNAGRLYVDGELIGWWKPGSPMGNYRGAHFVTPAPPGTEPIPFEGFDFRSDPAVKINQVLLQWYVTERYARAGTSDRNIVYFDDVVIATEYIGPMAARTDTD